MIFKKTDKSNYSIKTYSRGMRYGENGVSCSRQIHIFWLFIDLNQGGYAEWKTGTNETLCWKKKLKFQNNAKKIVQFAKIKYNKIEVLYTQL